MDILGFSIGKKPIDLTLKTNGAGDVTGVKLPEPPVFAIVDHCSSPRPNLTKVARALELQVNEHAGSFRPYGWGFCAKVIVAKSGTALPTNAIEVGLFDQPDQAGALGYHDVDPRGLPIIKVFPMLDETTGYPWSVTISHEILETLGNPDGNAVSQDWATGRMSCFEICDAVQNDFYKIDGIQVSNFVLPHYFAPPRDRTNARYDFLGLVKAPFEIRPGGYNQYFEDGQWKQVDNFGARGAPRTATGRLAAARRRAGVEA